MYYGIVWRAVYYSIVCPGGGLALFSLEGVWGAVGCGGRGASWTCGVLLCSPVQSSAVWCNVRTALHGIVLHTQSFCGLYCYCFSGVASCTR